MSLIPVVFLIFFSGFATGTENPQHLCTWLAKTEITDPNNPPTCMNQCRISCTNYPGEYFCGGFIAKIDTETDKLNQADPKEYVHCFCTRSKVTRTPGRWCAPGQLCPVDNFPNLETLQAPPDGPWIDGFNTMIPGSQGQQLLNIQAKDPNAVNDESSFECDDEAASKLRYMFGHYY